MKLTLARSTAAVGAVAVSVLLSSSAAAEVHIGWKGSTVIEDEDAGYSIKFGGRLLHDWSWIQPDRDLDDAFPDAFSDGAELRRARFYSSGTVYHVVYYKTDYDYAEDGTSKFKDVYLGVKKIPVLGSVRAGYLKEPIGLEMQGSSNGIPFMERAVTEFLVPSRNSGVLVERGFSDGRGTFAAGVFRDADDYGRAVGHSYNVTARATAVPYVEDGGRTLVHLGAAVSMRRPEGGDFSVAAKAATHMSPDLVGARDDSTRALEHTERVVLLGAEAAGILGPVLLQGEFVLASATNDTLNDPSFNSFYVEASYMLTGEHRRYESGIIEGITPAENFDGEGGRGAWEVAARFARIDLTDPMVEGGELSDVTLGLNWYLNPYARIMFNYVHADLDNVGTSNAFMTRFQVVF